MLVIAFDGILFDTLPFRAAAIVDALAAEGIAANHQHVMTLLPTRSLSECIRSVANASGADETSLDLASLRADRAISELGSRGATLNIAVRDRLRRAAAVTRIVVRADSRRRDAEQLIALADLDSAVSFLRCSDDVTSNEIRSAATQLNTVERSYAHIAHRLYSNRTLLGNSANIGIALEVETTGRAVAQAHGFTTPESFDATRLPGD